MKDLGAVLKELRTRKGLSLVKMAATSGVSKTAIIDIEQGRSAPSLKTLEGIAFSLSVRFVVDPDGVYIEDL